MDLPEQYGKGYLFAQHLGKDMSYVIMDLKLKVDLRLRRLASQENGLILFFNQVEITEGFMIRSGDDSIVDNNRQLISRHIIATPNDEVAEVAAGNHRLWPKAQIVKMNLLAVWH